MPSRRRIERASVQSGVQSAVQGGKATWEMHGRDGGAVRDPDRPIPFFLTDAPIPFACSDFAPPRRRSAEP